MGLVHTNIRSRLGIDKVWKMTIVGMDIKRAHIEAGLLCPCRKQSFSMGPGEGEMEAANHLDIDDANGLLDFHQLSEQLIACAAAASIPETTNPIRPVSACLTITIPPSTLLSTPPTTQPTANAMWKISILIESR